MGQEKGKKNVVLNIFTNTLFVLALIFLGVVVLASVIYIESPIDGASMAPTFNVNNDEKAFINKFKKGERGDVVVCNTHELDEDGNEVYIIKRIIAVAGDRVDIRYNEKNEVVVYLNGEALTEEYVSYKDRKNQLTGDDAFSYQSFKQYVEKTPDADYNSDGLLIKEGFVFVMGDNRAVSVDSTKYGPFKIEDVTGEVAFITKLDVNGKWAAIKFMLYNLFGAGDKTGYNVAF